jgi:condensin complex subunit 2
VCPDWQARWPLLQVDVKALKEIVWQGLSHSKTAAAADEQEPADSSVSFQDILAHVPDQSQAGDRRDLSVHLCFICLLHLANENGLVVKDASDLKTLQVTT